MILNQILMAREPLKRLTEKTFTSYKKVRELAKLRKVVEDEVEIYVGEEKKAVDKYAEKDTRGNPIFLDGGRIKLKDNQAKFEFEQEVAKLRLSEIESPVAVELQESDFKDSSDIPTPDDMLLLDGIVNFVD
jgi:hypothetical protein